MIDIGLIIRELRTEKKLTQEQLAAIMDVSVSTIRNWESAALFPSIDRLIKLARLFNVTLDYLTGLEKERKVVLNNLKPRQQDLIERIAGEFSSKKTEKISGLSESQKSIISDLIAEFTEV